MLSAPAIMSAISDGIFRWAFPPPGVVDPDVPTRQVRQTGWFSELQDRRAPRLVADQDVPWSSSGMRSAMTLPVTSNP